MFVFKAFYQSLLITFWHAAPLLLKSFFPTHPVLSPISGSFHFELPGVAYMNMREGLAAVLAAYQWL